MSEHAEASSSDVAGASLGVQDRQTNAKRHKRSSESSGEESPSGPGGVKRRRQAPLEKELAVRKTQRWWKERVRHGNLTKALVKDFFEKGMSLKTASEISFDDLAAKLREPKLLAVMTRIVQRVFYLSYGRKGTRRIAEANLNIRVFLAAYMIWFRKSFVFEHMGALEKDLHAASKPLLDSFHRICDELNSKEHIDKVARELTDDFPYLLNEYVTKFKAWKIPDETKLSERIKHALAALYQAESQLSADEPEGSKLRLEFQAQQERLRFKLLQVAGEKVLRDFDKQRGKPDLPLPTAEAVGAGAGSSASGGAGGGASAPSSAAPSTSGNMYSSLPGRMTNEQLAHELLLDPDFKLDDRGGSAVENPIFSRIRESFHKAFWDSLVDDLRLSPPCYFRVIRVLSEIRDGIAELGSGTKEAESINQVVNIDSIKEEVEAGRLEWGGCVQLVQGIVKVLERMQAKGRDGETRNQWSEMQVELQRAEEQTVERPAAFCKALEFVLDRVNTIRIDAANTRLRMIAPVIKIHGVEYERAHMEKKIKAGQTLERTEQWIARTVRGEVEAARVSLEELREGKAEAFKAVHERGVLNLVMDPEAVTSDTCPETLMLDLHRLQTCSAEFHFAVLGTTTMLELLNRKEAKKQLGEQLGPVADFFSTHTPRSWDLHTIQKELLKHLKSQGVSDECQDMVKQVVEKSGSESSGVRRICKDRIVQAWTATASSGHLPDSHQIPHIAKAFVERVRQHALKTRAVTQLNIKVHALHYNKMIAAQTRTLGGGDGGAPAAVAATAMPMDVDGSAPGGPA